MAKHRARRALFELLTKERGRGQGGPVGGLRPAPVIRRPAAAPAETPRAAQAAPPRITMPRPMAPARTPVVIGGVGLTYYHMAVVGVVILCLVALAYLVGLKVGGRETLPVTQPKPPMGDILKGPVTPGLVKPGPGPTRPGETPVPPGPGPEKPGRTETPVPPVGPQYRVRIVALDVSQPNAVDRLRAFLAQQGIETELKTSGGLHILYSLDRFADKKKSDELAAKVNKALEAFGKQTRQRTSTDAFSELVKKE